MKLTSHTKDYKHIDNKVQLLFAGGRPKKTIAIYEVLLLCSDGR